MEPTFQYYYLTEHFTILEPQNPEIGEHGVIQKNESTDFMALKNWDMFGRVGIPNSNWQSEYTPRYRVAADMDVVLCIGMCSMDYSVIKHCYGPTNKARLVEINFPENVVHRKVLSLFVRLSVESYLVRQISYEPEEPFHNFRASRSGDRRILCSSGTSCDGL